MPWSSWPKSRYLSLFSTIAVASLPRWLLPRCLFCVLSPPSVWVILLSTQRTNPRPSFCSLAFPWAWLCRSFCCPIRCPMRGGTSTEPLTLGYLAAVPRCRAVWRPCQPRIPLIRTPFWRATPGVARFGSRGTLLAITCIFTRLRMWFLSLFALLASTRMSRSSRRASQTARSLSLRAIGASRRCLTQR